jgi:hypothetical protein
MSTVDYVQPVEAVIPGVRGRVLGVLARTEVELTMRAVADLAGVSVQQTSVVLGRLVDLGVVGRREAGTAALVRLERDNQAAQAIVALADVRDLVVDQLRATARNIDPAPASLVIFGSFARGQARADSDLDVLAVRPAGTPDDDDGWTRSLGAWQDGAARVAGNPVNLLELGTDDLRSLGKQKRASLWHDAARDGVLLFGATLTELGLAA